MHLGKPNNIFYPYLYTSNTSATATNDPGFITLDPVKIAKQKIGPNPDQITYTPVGLSGA